MNQLSTGKLVVISGLLVSLAACEMGGDGAPQTNQPPVVALSASATSGPVSQPFTFTAAASDPEGDTLSYDWSLEGTADAPTATYTFAQVGSYTVSVNVSDGQNMVAQSVAVSVTEGTSTPPTDPTDPDPTDPTNPTDPTDPDPTNPTDPADPTEPDPTKPTLEVKASPGGPVPWAVRYDYSAKGYPSGSTYKEFCDGGDNYFAYETIFRVDNNSFVCFYVSDDDKARINVYPPGGSAKPISEDQFKAGAEPLTGVVFEGTWRYSLASGETGTFTITEGNESSDINDYEDVGGYDATGNYSIGYYIDVDSNEISLFFGRPGAETEAIFPQPLADGTQVYKSFTETDGLELRKID